MTIVYNQVVVEIRGGQTRQLSQREIANLLDGVEKMFGVVAHNPQALQYSLDRYCQRKGIRPLLITDVIL